MYSLPYELQVINNTHRLQLFHFFSFNSFPLSFEQKRPGDLEYNVDQGTNVLSQFRSSLPRKCHPKNSYIAPTPPTYTNSPVLSDPNITLACTPRCYGVVQRITVRLNLAHQIWSHTLYTCPTAWSDFSAYLYGVNSNNNNKNELLSLEYFKQFCVTDTPDITCWVSNIHLFYSIPSTLSTCYNSFYNFCFKAYLFLLLCTKCTENNKYFYSNTEYA